MESQKEAVLAFLRVSQETQEKRISNLKSLVESQEKIIGFQAELIELIEKANKKTYFKGVFIGAFLTSIFLIILNIIF